jgi:hypothetical protein
MAPGRHRAIRIQNPDPASRVLESHLPRQH